MSSTVAFVIISQDLHSGISSASFIGVAPPVTTFIVEKATVF